MTCYKTEKAQVKPLAGKQKSEDRAGLYARELLNSETRTTKEMGSLNEIVSGDPAKIWSW
jgi:hypothetical protein